MGKQKKDIWFIINAFAVALIVLAVMHTIKPYLEPPDPLKPQIMDYAASLKMIDAEAVPAVLASKNGKPTMVVVYASWCGYCRVKMPEIVAMMREGKLAHVNMLFLSRDKSLMELSKYLVHAGFYKDIDTYIVQNTEVSTLAGALAQRGSAFQGTVPFMEMYDANGNAVRVVPHNSQAADIISASKI